MSIFHAVILGIVQGLTEFLPISSSGHLILVPWLLGWDDFGGDASLAKAFDVALHIGTLVAVVAFYARDLAGYVTGGLRAVVTRPASHEGRIAWLIVLATLPALVAGAVLSDPIDRWLGKPWIIAFSLIFFALLLGWADQLPSSRRFDQLTRADAVQVGLAQVLALNPGTSRSGITMTAGRWKDFDRASAARLSFLMSIPVTAAAVVFKVGGLAKDGIPDGMLAPMIAGVLASAVSGWLTISALLKLVQTHSFRPFVIYRLAVGVIVLVLVASPWR
jgi:undecaprenyl-diphosphatase